MTGSGGNSNLGLQFDAGIAQLIERRLAKAKVAGLNPVSRSKIFWQPLFEASLSPTKNFGQWAWPAGPAAEEAPGLAMHRHRVSALNLNRIKLNGTNFPETEVAVVFPLVQHKNYAAVRTFF